jgi:NADH:ubiquinone oxidoreductase subunit F (NADH-binding)
LCPVGRLEPGDPCDQLDVPLTYEAMEALGTGLGTGGFIVYDDRTDPVELAAAVSRFLSVESCGQCPACKLGTMRVTEILSASTGAITLEEQDSPREPAQLSSQPRLERPKLERPVSKRLMRRVCA